MKKVCLHHNFNR